MPLASWAALHFYGPGCGAAIGTAGGSSPSAVLKGEGRLASVSTSVATSPLARMTRGLAGSSYSTAVAFSPSAVLKGRGRMGAVGRVNDLSQDDVTGAVLEAQIEPGLSLRQALRLIAAATAGRVSGAAGTTVTIRNAVADTKPRIVATVDANGNRTAIAYDVG